MPMHDASVSWSLCAGAICSAFGRSLHAMASSFHAAESLSWYCSRFFVFFAWLEFSCLTVLQLSCIFVMACGCLAAWGILQGRLRFVLAERLPEVAPNWGSYLRDKAWTRVVPARRGELRAPMDFWALFDPNFGVTNIPLQAFFKRFPVRLFRYPYCC